MDIAYWDGATWKGFGTTYRVYERSEEGGEIGTCVQALAVQGDVVIVGGHFQTLHKQGTDTGPLENYLPVNNVAGWNRATDTWFALGPQTATEEPGVTSIGFSGFGTDVNALAIIGSSVYIGGTFNLASSVAAANIVRWEAETNAWFPLDSGLAGIGNALRPTAVESLSAIGTDLFVAGHFTAAGPTEARFVGHWDAVAGAWNALGSGLRWYNDEFATAYSVAATPSGVYVGG